MLSLHFGFVFGKVCRVLCWTDAILHKYTESKPDLNTLGLVCLKPCATYQLEEQTEARKMLISRDSKQTKKALRVPKTSGSALHSCASLSSTLLYLWLCVKLLHSTLMSHRDLLHSPDC